MNPNRKFKDDIYEQFARVGKAVSSPKRLELLDLICQAPKTVETLAREACLTEANASRHLHILRGAGLIEGHKEGLYVTYSMADPAVCEFYRGLRLLAEKRLSDIDAITRRYLAGREGMEAVDRSDLIERVRNKSVTVIDVRPRDEYEAGHIPGAISIPLKELERRLADLPDDREVVAYCRGPYCVLSVQAVETLNAKGFRAIRIEDGVQDWCARGFEIEAGNPAH